MATAKYAAAKAQAIRDAAAAADNLWDGIDAGADVMIPEVLEQAINVFKQAGFVDNAGRLRQDKIDAHVLAAKRAGNVDWIFPFGKDGAHERGQHERGHSTFCEPIVGEG